MCGNLFRIFTFVFFIFLTIFSGPAKSFAQDNNGSSQEQTDEDNAQQALNQIHDLELKMQNTAKRLDALEKAVDNNSTIQEAPAIVQTEVPAPVQLVSAEQAASEIKAEPVDVLPRASVYYTPMLALPKEHTFELGQEEFYSIFKEPGDFSRKGAFYGITSAYTFRPLDAENWPINVFHVDVHGDYGAMNYNDGEGDKLKNINNYIVEPRAWLGKSFNFGSLNSLTPYVGVGYRWYYEELKNKEFLNLTDEEDNLFIQINSNNMQTQYIYIPVGAQLSVRPIDGWRIDMNSEYDFLAWGRVTEYSPRINSNFANFYSSSTNNTLRNGYGIRGSIKIIKEGSSVNYFVEPYIRYWNIRASNTVTSTIYTDGVPVLFAPIQQDKNHTTEIGARLGVEF